MPDPFAKPSTGDGEVVVRGGASGTDIIIIDRHKSFTCGNSVQEAFALLEVLEKYCKMDYYAGMSGREIRYLTDEQTKEIGKIVY